MLEIAASLVPVFLLIVAGILMRKWDFPGAAFWPPAERITYFVFFPALLTYSLATAELRDFDPLPMAAALLSAILCVAAALILLKPWLALNGPAFTSVFQGALRFNTYVGLGSVAALYGVEGVSLFAVAIAVAVPSLNVLCVAALARWAHQGMRPSLGSQLRMLAQNPLIVACLLGIALNLSGIRLPWGAAAVLEILGSAALPLGLLAVGVALDLPAARAAGHRVLATSAAKLILLPLVMAGTTWLFAVDGLSRTIVILWATLPSSSTAYILARQMGGDAPLLASIITAATAAAFVTMPIMLWLLG